MSSSGVVDIIGFRIGSFTGVHVYASRTLFAFDFTTPVEFALTLLNLNHSFRIVAASAAHNITAVRS